ncbi:MAG: FAD-dependent oxidoreductase [Planctomycetota bacterium]
MNQPTDRDPSPGLNRAEHDCDVCVVGGGLSGLCAAIASARRGARTVLLHDRPVLGGNASSEVRMWVCGAHGPDQKETGLLEEVLCDNAARNGPLNYSIWDSVLYEKAMFQPNLTTLLNTAVCDGQREGDRLASVRAWQLTSQTWVTVHAKLFVDCSGDSILAPLSGARTRWGRESRDAFGEDIQPAKSDRKTMGNSLLIQLRRTDREVPFVPPKWAYRFDTPADVHHRLGDGVNGRNFWWIELGGLDDTVRDAEAIARDLYRTAWGVWDYIKNRAPERDRATNWALEWIGALPGKRENRRYVGDHTLTQLDIEAGTGRFADVIGHGGWSMDDHHPAGLLYPGDPTIFHPAPPAYDIPWRCLYAADVPNLLCAGRNISVTHAALSSTRVMATCAVLGQAAGTGAALCVGRGTEPRDLADGEARTQLQRWLMDDDQWLPEINRPADPVMAGARLAATGDDPARLTDGQDRDRPKRKGRWEGPLGEPIAVSWPEPRDIGGLRLVCDSNLRDGKKMPASYPQPAKDHRVAPGMLRGFRVEARRGHDRWETVYHETDNHQRLVRVPLRVRTDALRLVPTTTWGEPTARLYGFEAVESLDVSLPHIETEYFRDRVGEVPAADLADPPKAGSPRAQPTGMGA